MWHIKIGVSGDQNSGGILSIEICLKLNKEIRQTQNRLSTPFNNVRNGIVKVYTENSHKYSETPYIIIIYNLYNISVPI